MPPRVALVTAQNYQALDEDLPLLAAALEAYGVRAEVLNWDDPKVRWESYPLTVIRSPWDYPARSAEFIAWVDRVSSRTRLCNRQAVIRWNVDKHYLKVLGSLGISVIPTTYVHPGETAQLPDADLVIKPTISAGARDTGRFGP